MTRRADSILELMGETPIVRLNKLNPHPRVEVYVKLEYFNPGGSIKDRPALAMIEAAEASGELTPGKTVIEATSGNTGIGLALVCAVKGYRLLLAMSESASEERKRILRAMGAEILLTPAHLGTDGAIEEVYRMARENPASILSGGPVQQPPQPRVPSRHGQGDLGADRGPGHPRGGYHGHHRHPHGPDPVSEGATVRISGWWGWSLTWATPSRG